MKSFLYELLHPTCLRRSCAENFDRLSLEFETGAIGLPDPIPPDSRSSCSMIAGTKNLNPCLCSIQPNDLTNHW